MKDHMKDQRDSIETFFKKMNLMWEADLVFRTIIEDVDSVTRSLCFILNLLCSLR